MKNSLLGIGVPAFAAFAAVIVLTLWTVLPLVEPLEEMEREARRLLALLELSLQLLIVAQEPFVVDAAVQGGPSFGHCFVEQLGMGGCAARRSVSARTARRSRRRVAATGQMSVPRVSML